jgi:transposase
MDLKEKMRLYQKKYILNHSQIIKCPECGKEYKQYRSKAHLSSIRHLKHSNKNSLINLKNNNNNPVNLKDKFIVSFY